MAKKWTAVLMAILMVLTAFPVTTAMAAGSSEASKPADGTTENRPFISGNPSANYRIPAMVTLDDGTIVAAADARWNDQKDGGGNDVITARSTDNGDTWSYSWAGYYGDNGNVFNKASTSYCDSNLTTDGTNVYLLSTFFASGVAINGSSANSQPEKGTGMNEQGQLVLKKSGDSSYDYYVGDFNSDDFAPILNKSGADSGYKVNGEYELYKDGKREGCVWYSDCLFQAYKTQYLFLRKSTNGGKTWSRISIVNVKGDDEKFVGAGPGRGIVLEDGTICMPVYVYGAGGSSSGSYSQATSFIYSKDNGKTWSRTGNFTTPGYKFLSSNDNWSSEAQLVDLGNGVVRCFYRNGKKKIMYCDATWNGSGFQWGSVVDTGIDICGDCMISAISYSYKVNGKKAILVSTPSDSGSRTTGAIYALLLNDDNSVSEYTKKVITSNGATFQYSCLTELADGRVADLYENGGADFSFQTFSVASLTGGTVELPEISDIQLSVGNSCTLDFDTEYTSTDDANIHIQETARKQIPGATVKKASDVNYDGEEVSAKQALYTFKNVSDDVYKVYHAGMYLSVGTNGKAGYPGASKAANVTLRAVDGGFQLLQDGHYGLYFQQKDSKGNTVNHFERWDFTGKGKNDQDEAEVLAATTFQLYRRIRTGETGSTELPGYIQVNAIESGEGYLIVYKGTDGYFLLNPSTSTTNMYAHCLKATGNSISDGYAVTFLGKKETTTPVVLKDAMHTYSVTVSNDVREVTGAVKYDPVIYTHGSMTDGSFDIGYMMLGNQIADATVEGEKKTEYTVADGYSIVSVKCTSVSGADITVSSATGTGMLKGSLPSEDITGDVASGMTVTLETVVQDSHGISWTQYDKLYVASNPVAGHLYGAAQAYLASNSSYVAALPFIVTANGSYGNTSVTKVYNEKWDHNAKDLYTANALGYSNESDAKDRLVTIYASGSEKNAGHGEYANDKVGNIFGSGGTGTLTMDHTSPILAYYYFDKSSNSNQGLTNLGNGKFSLTFGYTPVKITSTGSNEKKDSPTTLKSSPSDFTGTAGLTQETDLNLSYNMGSVSRQTIKVNGDAGNNTSMTGNVKFNFDGEWKTNDKLKTKVTVVLPFEVIICDKSSVRTPYDEATSKVRKSTDYTTSTWNAYRDGLLDAQAYLNNYTNTGEYKPDSTVDSIVGDTGSYETLTKRVDFTELDKALADNKQAYDKGFDSTVVGTQNTYTVDSYTAFETAYKTGKDLSDSVSSDERSNTAGYTVGPDSTTKDLQQQVDSAADALNQVLVPAADASAYESARSISATIDRTAFPDGGTAITNTVTSGNGTIYKAYNGKDYVNVPAALQDTVDGFTTDLLSHMNVGESSTSGRIFTVACTVNGTDFETKEQKTQYHYGTIAHLDFSAYKTQDTVCVVHTATGDTKIDLAKCNYQLALLVQQDTTITVTTATSPNVIVADYFGTILGAFVGATSVTVQGNTVTVGNTVITAKDSPKYTFTGWTWSEGTHQVPAGQVAQIVQKGTRTGVDVNYTVSNNGTAANALINGATQYTAPGINKPLELTSDNAQFWTRTVNGVESLASYEKDLTLFSSNVDTQFKAYNDVNSLPTALQNQAMSGTPVAYGVGFFADNKFTLSCDYSAGKDVTVLEVGVIYSTTKNGKDTLVKGGDDVQTVVSRNVANWTGSPNSGTFTMTKKGSDTGSHYMRMYVSYRASRMNTQVPFVVYGDIYQCVNGAVSAVN